MRIVAVLGARKDLGFVRFLKKVFEKSGLRTQCVFSECDEHKLRRIVFAKNPEILILFFEEGLSLFRRAHFKADILIPLKRSSYWSIPVKKGAFVILSSDDKKIFPFFIKRGLSLITCGVNSKASITVSSMDKDEGIIQCCVQRQIVDLTGRIFESQEFPFERDEKESVDRVLVAVGALIATGNFALNPTSKT